MVNVENNMFNLVQVMVRIVSVVVGINPEDKEVFNDAMDVIQHPDPSVGNKRNITNYAKI